MYIPELPTPNIKKQERRQKSDMRQPLRSDMTNFGLNSDMINVISPSSRESLRKVHIDAALEKSREDSLVLIE